MKFAVLYVPGNESGLAYVTDLRRSCRPGNLGASFALQKHMQMSRFRDAKQRHRDVGN